MIRAGLSGKKDRDLVGVYLFLLRETTVAPAQPLLMGVEEAPGLLLDLEGGVAGGLQSILAL